MAMRLTNYVIESNLYNGIVGVIRDIVYENKEGPNFPDNLLPAYVVLEIPTLKWNGDYVWDKNNPTYAPILCAQFFCDNMCCTSSAIPLCVFKGNSIHKSQGMFIGDGMPFPKVAIGLPSGKQRKTPGVELTAFSRATDVEALCLVGKISKDVLLKIGRGKSYEKKRLFEEHLYKLQNGSIQKYVDLIANSDTSNRNEKSFCVSFYKFVKWWRDLTGTKMKQIDVEHVNKELLEFKHDSIEIEAIIRQRAKKIQPKAQK